MGNAPCNPPFRTTFQNLPTTINEDALDVEAFSPWYITHSETLSACKTSYGQGPRGAGHESGEKEQQHASKTPKNEHYLGQHLESVLDALNEDCLELYF